MQSRLRKRGRLGKYSYIHTIRKQVSTSDWLTQNNANLWLVAGWRTGDRGEDTGGSSWVLSSSGSDWSSPLDSQQVINSDWLTQININLWLVCRTRRCFMYNNQYFQLDIYKEPCHPRCSGLMLLGNTFFWLDDTILISDWFIETYTTLSADEFQQRLPKFLNVDQQVENLKKRSQNLKIISAGYWRPCILNVQSESSWRVDEQQEVLSQTLWWWRWWSGGHWESIQQVGINN